MKKTINNAGMRIAALEERLSRLERNFAHMDLALTTYSLRKYEEMAEYINKTMKTHKVDVKISPRAEKKINSVINKTAKSRVSK